nr:trehalose-phosphatase [Brevibacterium yomogidense]
MDFDGVIAPLQDDPRTSTPLPASAEAVAQIAALPRTPVGYISGRNMAVLQDLSKAPANAIFIGSHGLETDFSALGRAGLAPSGTAAEAPVTTPSAAEAPAATPADAEAPTHSPSDAGFSTPLTQEEDEALAALDGALDDIRSRTPADGFGELRVERKPLGRTAHTRGTSPNRAEFFLAELDAVAERMPHLRSFSGHAMTEFAVRMETKGHGLARMIEATGADAVVFLGDDTTDEDAFAYLNERDDLVTLPVKVGTQDTCAPFRIADPDAVSAFLARLADARATSLRG